MIKEMTGAERDKYEYFVNVTAKDNWQNIRARLAQLSMVDTDGALLFSDGDIDEIGALPAAGLDQIFKAALELNKIGADDIDDLETT